MEELREVAAVKLPEGVEGRTFSLKLNGGELCWTGERAEVEAKELLLASRAGLGGRGQAENGSEVGGESWEGEV